MYGINFYFNIIYNNIFVFFLVLLDRALGGVNIFVIHPVYTLQSADKVFY